MHKHSRKNGRAGHDMRHNLSKVKDALSMTARDVGTQALDTFEDAKDRIIDKTSNIQGSMADYIGDKPFKAVGLAVLSGLILGYAMHKKKRRFHSHR